jgi:Txe/YoeB family toxin of Txe-Axe toxin-antitoxin module
MGAEGSGRRINAKTRLVYFGMDVQMECTKIIHAIKNENATKQDITNKLIKIVQDARKVCEENESL